MTQIDARKEPRAAADTWPQVRGCALLGNEELEKNDTLVPSAPLQGSAPSAAELDKTGQKGHV